MLQIAFLFFSLSISCFCKDVPIVTTDLGKIRGFQKSSFSGKIYSAFEGVPYAVPPIGERRFEVSEPITKWDGIWEANYPQECAQVPHIYENFSSFITGDEDCLYLNIYVPRTQIDPSEKLPVIVHIHGGGFIWGSGHEYAYPGFLMDHDIIFVSINYRLGIFGFLSTDDDSIPGNNGMKDQVLALKWVKQHICKFGGDPNEVTLFGGSAGGASVHLHYLSPMSEGLFKRGFSHSGTALNPWVIKTDNLKRSKSLAAVVGCPHSSSVEIKKCLKEKHFRQLLSNMQVFYGYKIFPLVALGPVVEQKSGFISKEPLELLKESKVQNLPWMASFVSQEVYEIFEEHLKEDIEDLNSRWQELAPLILSYNYSLPKESWHEVAEKIRNFYFGKEKFCQDNFKILTKLGTDRIMIDGIVESVELQSKTSPVFLYEFSYTGASDVVSHFEDITFFFFNETQKLSQDELKMKDVMVNLLVSFAKTGKPDVNGVDWQNVESNNFSFLNISGYTPQDLKIVTNKNVGNGEFWRSINL